MIEDRRIFPISIIKGPGQVNGNPDRSLFLFCFNLKVK